MPTTLSAYALTTLAAAKALLDIETTDTSKDDVITQLINGATAAIETYCKRKLMARTFTDEWYGGKGYQHLILRQYPINTLTSVSTLDDDDIATAVTVTKKDGEAGIIYYPKNTGTTGGVWPEGDINIKVTYNAGYATIPDDLELACKLLVEFYYKLSIADFSTVFGEGGVTMKPESFPGKVKHLIGSFKKVRI